MRFLQMPMGCHSCSECNAELFVTELIPGIDYLRVSHFLNAHATKNKSCTPKLSKAELKKLLVLAQSDIKESSISVQIELKHQLFYEL